MEGKWRKGRRGDGNKRVLGSHNNNLYISKWNFIPCLLSQCHRRSPWGAQQCVLITIQIHAYLNHTKLKFFHFNFLPEKEMSSDKGFFSPDFGETCFIYLFYLLFKLLVTFVNGSVCFTFLQFYNRQAAEQIGAAGSCRER